MAITGKKFSELTAEQKIATREAITGWIVNNLFVNPLGTETTLLNESSSISLTTDGQIMVVASDIVITLNSNEAAIGTKTYFVNFLCTVSTIQGFDENITILPYSTTGLSGVFGVFQVEKTDINEWTISVIENGTVIDNGLG